MSYTSLNGFKTKSEPPQKPVTPPANLEATVKFAGEEAKDKLYEPKHKKKLVRVLTVVAYVFFVSLAALMLSLYYVFLWNGDAKIETRVISIRFEPNPLLQQLAETRAELKKLQEEQQKQKILVRCNDVISDMQQQITAYEEEPNGESTTALPTITTTEEENTTWQDYGNDFEQIRKRSIFIKKIMNFKHSYDDIQ